MNRIIDEKITYEAANKDEIVWTNPRYIPFDYTDALCQLIVSDEDIKDAEERLKRFAPFIMKKFPETVATEGIIESELVDIPLMKESLSENYGCDILGRLMLKKDSHLAISGSVKARGGFYEVLKHAEELALDAGLIKITDSYERFADADMREFFSNYTVQVGSTGNLGMSIGIMSEAIGFNVIVHMSSDAKQWKKDLLRSRGVNVIEYSEDYSKAVEEGRKNSAIDPKSYFVDDEKSLDLFMGYAVAANRLQRHFEKTGITVDDEHPLIVYIPAGVGGAPGGVSYGLKRIYKDNVHCFFVEPAQCPSVLLGIATQKYEKANVRDYSLSAVTDADGLACASPSSLVTRIMTNLVSGIFTVSDQKLYDILRLMHNAEDIKIEPSACAGFAGVIKLLSDDKTKDYCNKQGLTKEILSRSTQIVWATGGSLVPEHIMEEYLKKYL